MRRSHIENLSAAFESIGCIEVPLPIAQDVSAGDKHAVIVIPDKHGAVVLACLDRHPSTRVHQSALLSISRRSCARSRGHSKANSETFRPSPVPCTEHRSVGKSALLGT